MCSSQSYKTFPQSKTGFSFNPVALNQSSTVESYQFHLVRSKNSSQEGSYNSSVQVLASSIIHVLPSCTYKFFPLGL